MSSSERIAQLEDALRYISCPTMGYNGPLSPEEFARNMTDLENLQGALATCIWIATEALKEKD